MKQENIKRLKYLKFISVDSIIFAIAALLTYQLTGDILFSDFFFSPLVESIMLLLLAVYIWIEINKIIKSEQE